MTCGSGRTNAPCRPHRRTGSEPRLDSERRLTISNQALPIAMTFLGCATSKQLGHLCVDGQFFTRKAQLAVGVVQQQHARRESARLRKGSDLKNLVTGGAS